MKRSYLSDRCDVAVLPAACLQQEPSKVETNAAAVLLFNSKHWVCSSFCFTEQESCSTRKRSTSLWDLKCWLLCPPPPPPPVSFNIASKVQCTSTSVHTVRCRRKLCARCCNRGKKKQQQLQVVCIDPKPIMWICQCVVILYEKAVKTSSSANRLVLPSFLLWWPNSPTSHPGGSLKCRSEGAVI